MSLPRRSVVVLSIGLASLGSALAGPAPEPPSSATETGFVVVAPDRGFLGNEETRDAFDVFASGRNAALVFVTDERTRASLDSGFRSLAEAGARRAVVLPFFLSRSDPGFGRVQSMLATPVPPLPVTWARAFGESYLAIEALSDRLRRIEARAGRRLVVVGAGARDEESQRRMAADWQRLAATAAGGLGFESVRVVLESSRAKVGGALAEASRGGPRPVIVPFHLGSKLDGMMSYTSLVRGALPDGVEMLEGDVTPDASVVLWMAREANRHAAYGAEDVGVVVLAHGSDYHWNETMRQAVSPLAQRYKVEPAFSMADPVVIGRAVRRLEERGARFIVILRVFALAASFRSDVERLIGQDVESADPSSAAPGHDHGSHEGHARSEPAARLRSAAFVTTVGGLEDDALFAQALLERARSLSRDPARETVILVAHGEGDDARDAHWREMLATMAARIASAEGDPFRAVHVATWREDWPEKRGPAVAHVRSLVQEASIGGGRAIVIPARTLGHGPERRLLEGLTFDLGEGFAPHPLFARWADKEVAAAVAEQAAVVAHGDEGATPAAASVQR